MRIPCPFCGERGNEEFAYLGDAERTRPAPDASEADWADYVYLRDNPAGPHQEFWYHASGCQSWLRVTRDTRTHDVLNVAPAMQEAA